MLRRNPAISFVTIVGLLAVSGTLVSADFPVIDAGPLLDHIMGMAFKILSDGTLSPVANRSLSCWREPISLAILEKAASCKEHQSGKFCIL